MRTILGGSILSTCLNVAMQHWATSPECDTLRVATEMPDLSATGEARSRPTPPGRVDVALLAADVAGLGYPALSYLRSPNWTPKNPGDVVLLALAQNDLEARLVEALPWLVLRYATIDWNPVVREAELYDLQNRLGFVVALAREFATRSGDENRASTLRRLEAQLERNRLSRQDTLCRSSLPDAERRWLVEHRSEAAKHWNLLTDWTADALRYTK